MRLAALLYLGVSEELIGVSGHDDISVLNHTPEGGEGLLGVQHQLQEAPVHLVDSQHRPNTLSECLCRYNEDQLFSSMKVSTVLV